MTTAQKLVLVLLAMAVSFGAAWQMQDWRYDGKLARQAEQFQTHLDTIGNAAIAKARAEQDKRLAIEQQLATSDQQHTKELSDAQRNQDSLRDRLATADLRLSVLLDVTDSAGGCDVPATPGGAGVVHAARRAQLDPAHAQRIIAITNEADDAVIALRACQAYVRAIAQ
ncbi:lysis system i-spanin subunit Rz [Pseudomonas poae]|uniref:lysis system i-spanin subunit Rz n=1 Tax=Pseudomonas poae TaxID=200451 RepID=UPI0030D1CA62